MSAVGRSPADLALHSGTVVTVDRDFRTTEAVAVRDGRVLATGTTSEIRALSGPGTREVDLAGGSVLPGINDSHLHLLWYALTDPSRHLDLSGAGSLAQVRALVAERAASLPEDAWLLGRGGTPSRSPVRDLTGPPQPTWTTSAVADRSCSSTSAATPRG